jgi:hypothetical protein
MKTENQKKSCGCNVEVEPKAKSGCPCGDVCPCGDDCRCVGCNHAKK